MVQPRVAGEREQQRQRHPVRHAAGVRQPLPDAQADDVQPGGQRDARQSDHEEIGAARRERLRLGAAHEQGVAGGEEQQPGKVRQVRGPVAPAGEKRGKGAECRFAPQVHAAFTGMARRQLEDREHERNEETQRAQHPEPHGAGSCRRRRGHPAQAEAGDEVEEDEVTNAEDAGQASRGRHDRLRASGHGRSTTGFRPACQLSDDGHQRRPRFATAGVEQHASAVWRDVPVPVVDRRAAAEDRGGEQDPRAPGLEARAAADVHAQQLSPARDVEQFLAVGPPPRLIPAAVRHRPLAAGRRRKRSHVHLTPAAFVGHVGHEAGVRRERRVGLAITGDEKRLGRALSRAGHRQHPQVFLGGRIHAVVKQPKPVSRPRERIFADAGYQDRLVGPGAVGRRRIEIEASLTIPGEHDTAAVGRPHRLDGARR